MAVAECKEIEICINALQKKITKALFSLCDYQKKNVRQNLHCLLSCAKQDFHNNSSSNVAKSRTIYFVQFVDIFFFCFLVLLSFIFHSSNKFVTENSTKTNGYNYFANNTTIVCNSRRKVKTIGKEKISLTQVHI